MNPFSHTGLSISDSLKSVRKSVLIYETIIQSVLHQKVVATGNPLMLVQFRQNLQMIERELERIEKASDMDGELLTPIRSMLEILEGFKEQPRTLADMKHLTVPNEE